MAITSCITMNNSWIYWFKQEGATFIFCDNNSTIKNVQELRSKHNNVKYFLSLRDFVDISNFISLSIESLVRLSLTFKIQALNVFNVDDCHPMTCY